MEQAVEKAIVQLEASVQLRPPLYWRRECDEDRFRPAEACDPRCRTRMDSWAAWPLAGLEHEAYRDEIGPSSE